MSNSYLITIDNEFHHEKDEILKYILENIDIQSIDEIKCISSDDIGDLCKKNIKQLGKTFKCKEDTNDICHVCDDIFKCKEIIFSFSNCEHKFHKKCMTKHLKTCKTNICPCCKDKHLENILNIF
jgi:hypothetical protein